MRMVVVVVTIHQMFQFVIYVIAVTMSVVDLFEVFVPKQQVRNTVLHQWHHHLGRGMQVKNQQNPDCAFFHFLGIIDHLTGHFCILEAEDINCHVL
jgi:hypothetical protein